VRESLRFFLNRFPNLKQRLRVWIENIPFVRGVSSRYAQINQNDVELQTNRLRNSWQSKDIPLRQRALVDKQLLDYRNGKRVDVFDTMVRALHALPTNISSVSVLEVGCSSGFYSEVFEIDKFEFCYTGCDYSKSFIELARKKYPSVCFDIEDATALSYANNAFDVVISGCCLLHIPDFEVAIAETARVTRGYAIFHRTPVVLGQPNVFYRKQAYGVETVEIHFNEPQFLNLITKHGLDLIATYTLSESLDGGVGSANRTYVCRKIAQ
jgi:SAM-dependent methyltransferase